MVTPLLFLAAEDFDWCSGDKTHILWMHKVSLCERFSIFTTPSTSVILLLRESCDKNPRPVRCCISLTLQSGATPHCSPCNRTDQRERNKTKKKIARNKPVRSALSSTSARPEGTPEEEPKVCALQIKSALVAMCYISHPITRALFLIDATISKVTTPVNHQEVEERRAIRYPGCISVLLG